MKPASLSPVWTIDAIKAVASQVILWHHFLAYGPLAKTLYPHGAAWFDGLAEHGPNAVQAFLVLGGFLAARSLRSLLEPSPSISAGMTFIRLLWKRYIRLSRPYLFALLLVILSAACARLLVTDPDTPATATFMQVVSHALLLHDIVGAKALSVGVWYVAIDFQLYGVLLFLIWLAQRIAPVIGLDLQRTALLFVTTLLSFSMLWLNRIESLDILAIYFFGSYGIGVVLAWATGQKFELRWIGVLVFVGLAALVIEWRDRLGTALFTAVLLTVALRTNHPRNGGSNPTVTWFGRLSYSVFLVHYPVVLLVGSIVASLWPESLFMALVGFAVSWLLTMALAHWVHHRIELARRPHSEGKSRLWATPKPEAEIPKR